MGLANRLASIFTRKNDSEVFYLTKTIDKEIDSVVNQMSEVEIQTVLSSSTGDWLNLWGNKFGIGRGHQESDEEYRKRIIESVTALKGTVPALIAAVKRALGEDTGVLVKQTYEDLRIFNVSTFSGVGKFQDSDTIRLGVILLQIDKEPNDRLRSEIYRTKAMGTRVIIETRMEMLNDEEIISEDYQVPQSRIAIDDAESVSGLLMDLLDIEIIDISNGEE